jgi:hypothetical protein
MYHEKHQKLPFIWALHGYYGWHKKVVSTGVFISILPTIPQVIPENIPGPMILVHKHWIQMQTMETHGATESCFTEDFCFLVIGLGSSFSIGMRPTREPGYTRAQCQENTHLVWAPRQPSGESHSSSPARPSVTPCNCNTHTKKNYTCAHAHIDVT